MLELDALAATDETTPPVRTRASFYSFLAALRLELGAHQRVSLRVPWTVGSVRLGAEREQQVSAIGNLELAVAHDAWLSRALRSMFVVSLIAPTAVGFAPDNHGEADHHEDRDDDHRGRGRGTDDDDDGEDPSTLDALQRAASLSRGLQDGALFEVGRAGVAAMASFDYLIAGLRISAFAKLESLVRTRGAEHDFWMNTALIGAEAAYPLGPYAQLSARAWHAVPLSEAEGSVTALEPSISLRIAEASLTLGALVVLADELVRSRSLGLHVVASAGF